MVGMTAVRSLPTLRNPFALRRPRSGRLEGCVLQSKMANVEMHIVNRLFGYSKNFCCNYLEVSSNVKDTHLSKNYPQIIHAGSTRHRARLQMAADHSRRLETAKTLDDVAIVSLLNAASPQLYPQNGD